MKDAFDIMQMIETHGAFPPKQRRKRMYEPGPPFRDMNELAEWIYSKREYVFWGGRAMHPSILHSMTFRTVFVAAFAYTNPTLRKAIKNEG